eukprot:CAMPEP_0184743060 /NCGR_PEP_ID=MMETSP0315-20130426/5938_1 /TAXON_ID=101924 /ORGANISM="Rhodosorus marinus, Strain UTEX LB 2760" /LENGTH=580 /DNA_ID=CAMNT_0027214147 /DNA_START=218 /DNA_END=1960 /DNA_ORIENTATION=+
MGDLAEGLEYSNFRAWVPRRQVKVGRKISEKWVYYDWGRRENLEPLLCVHDLIGDGDVFFGQMLYLVPRGYRVISVSLPEVETFEELVYSFEALLRFLKTKRVHLYGAGLGAMFCLVFSAKFPERVSSIAMTHATLSLAEYKKRLLIYRPFLWVSTAEIVREALLEYCPCGLRNVREALATEFALNRTFSRGRRSIIRRLLLCTSPEKLNTRIRVPDDYITLIDPLNVDRRSLISSKAAVSRRFQGARIAHIKRGGEFPYQSEADDVSIHLLLHLRRHAKAPCEPLVLPPPSKALFEDPCVVRVLKDTVYRKGRERHTLKSRIVVLDSSKRFMGPTHLISKYRKEILALQEAAPLAPIAQLAVSLEASNGNVQSVLGRIQSSPYGVLLSGRGPHLDLKTPRQQSVLVNGSALRGGEEAHEEAQTAIDEPYEGALDSERSIYAVSPVGAVGGGSKYETAAEDEPAESYLLGTPTADKRVPTSLIDEGCGVGKEDTFINRNGCKVQAKTDTEGRTRLSPPEAPEPLTTERLSYQLADDSLADEFESDDAMRILLMRFRAHGERLEKENSRQATEGIRINRVR